MSVWMESVIVSRDCLCIFSEHLGQRLKRSEGLKRSPLGWMTWVYPHLGHIHRIGFPAIIIVLFLK